MNNSELNEVVKQPMSVEEIGELYFLAGLGESYLKTIAMAFCYGKKRGKDNNNGRVESD